MINKQPYLIFGIVSALTIYISLILLFVFYFYENMRKPKVYAMTKETVVELSLESLPKEPDIKKEIKKEEVKKEEPKKEEPKKEEVKKEEKKEEPKPITKNEPTVNTNAETAASSSAKSTTSANVKSLFASLDVPKPEEKVIKEIPVKEQQVASRFKSKEIESVKKSEPQLDVSKLMQNVSVSKSSTSKSTISFEKKGGEVQDDYYSEIYKILAEAWIPESSDAAQVGIVLVTVTSSGEFDYKIKKASNDENFNQKLTQFLEDMKLMKFPPYTKGSKTVVEVYFKTEE